MDSRDKPAVSAAHVLARIRSLQHHRAARESSRTFWIEGIRQFMQAAEAGFRFDTIVHSRLLLKSSLVRHAIDRMAAGGVAHIRVTPEQFRGVSVTEHASGVGAIVRQRWTALHQADAAHGLCWLVLESVRSAGNLGTILRTAEATGVAGVILLDHACDPYNLPVVRASMGGIFHLQLVRTTHGHLRRWANSHRMKLIALTPSGEDLWRTPNAFAIAACDPSPLALLIGEERQGLSARAMAMSDLKIRLPMTGRADSLNLGVAASVMMYELVRRRATAAPR